MLKIKYFITDVKRLLRDPITALLLFAPILISIIFRLIWVFVPPTINKHFSFNLLPYSGYMMSFVFILIAGMVAIVMGFSMQEDKDSNMTMLFCVTPLGRKGYLTMRLSMVVIFVAIHSVISYFILGQYLPLVNFVAILIMLCMLSCALGIALFRLAKDKVQGLTVAKGINIVILFLFGNLLDSKIINAVCAFFPTYWIGKTILYSESYMFMIIGLLVSSVWLGVAILISNRMDKEQ